MFFLNYQNSMQKGEGPFLQCLIKIQVYLSWIIEFDTELKDGFLLNCIEHNLNAVLLYCYNKTYHSVH